MLTRLRDTLQAHLCYQMFITPLHLPFVKPHRDKIAKAKRHMQQIRSQKIIIDEPKHHVIHSFLPNGVSKAKILINHGWMSRSLYMLGIIDALYQAGYSVYAMDFPAHGDSKGLQLHWYQSVGAIAEAQRRFGPFDCAIGHSYGGFMLLYTLCMSGELNMPLMDKLALIATPVWVTSPIKNIGKKCHLNPQAYLMFRNMLTQSYQQDAANFDILARLKNTPTQILAIHGCQDKTISCHESIHLCQHIENASLCLKQDLNHIDIIFNQSVYKDLLTFIGE